MKTKIDIKPNQLDRVIEMAWEDRTPFDAIWLQFGLKEEEVIRIMRREMSQAVLKCGAQGFKVVKLSTSNLLDWR